MQRNIINVLNYIETNEAKQKTFEERWKRY